MSLSSVLDLPRSFCAQTALPPRMWPLVGGLPQSPTQRGEAVSLSRSSGPCAQLQHTAADASPSVIFGTEEGLH